ncbi:MAG: DUF2314 domain-containing protein [Verrucomicrobiales bacterium]|nr:DUF2314 domain-containing protein [Verrucomicrobiales bacterium]
MRFPLRSSSPHAPTRPRKRFLFTGGYDEAEMDAAMENARQHVEHFITAFEKGEGENYSVKAAISDDENTEYFWIVDLSYADGEFSGFVGNDPGLVTNVKYGDELTIAKDEISDWMYIIGEKIHGNYTMRVMFPGMPAEEAAMWKKQLAPLPE